MADTSPKNHRNLEAISHDKDGHLALGASSLNMQCWTGALSYFEKPTDAPTAPTATAPVGSGITDLDWIPDSDRIAACTDSGMVYLWKLLPERNALTCLSTCTEHDDIISSMSVNCNGSKFATASYDRSIKIWEAEDFVPVSHYTAHFDIVWDVAFHPTQPDILISCSQDGRMLLWDLRKPKPASNIDCNWLPSIPTCVAWQPGSEHKFAVGTETGRIVLQDCRAEIVSPVTVSAHNRLIHRLAFSPNRSNWLASVSHDSTAAVTEFESTSGAVIYRDLSHKDFVQGLSWNPTNNHLTTCSWDFKVVTREVLAEVETPVAQQENGSNKMETDQALD